MFVYFVKCSNVYNDRGSLSLDDRKIMRVDLSAMFHSKSNIFPMCFWHLKKNKACRHTTISDCLKVRYGLNGYNGYTVQLLS